MKGKIADGEARDRLIIWIRRRMEELGISMEALSASIEHDKAHPPLYRDARGHEWNGLGNMPDWLIAAKNAGVKGCSSFSCIFWRFARENAFISMS